MLHTCNPSISVAEVGRVLQVWGQPTGYHTASKASNTQSHSKVILTVCQAQLTPVFTLAVGNKDTAQPPMQPFSSSIPSTTELTPTARVSPDRVREGEPGLSYARDPGLLIRLLWLRNTHPPRGSVSKVPKRKSY